ncbi:EpsG family protein [Pectobacterium versatile]|uniref:EpsG family protein n=1 Tax=Pectobacterium versatile TaxID=2488639 RepID=UPI0032EAF9D0
MIYYIAFLILVSSLLIFSSYNKALSNTSFYATVFITMLFSGFRYDAGNDFFTYVDMINGFFPYEKIEPIPRYLIIASSYLNSPWVFFLSTSIMYILSICYFCVKLSPSPRLSFFMFCVMPISLLTSFGYARQFLAIGFFSVSLVNYLRGGKKGTLLFFFLAAMSHYSAMFFFPIFFMYRLISYRKLSLVSYCIILASSFASSGVIVSLADYIGSYGSYISEERFIDSGKKIGYVAIGMFFWFYTFSRNLKDKDYIFLLNMYFMFACAYAILLPFGEYIIRVIYFLFPISYVLFAKTLTRDVNARVVQLMLVISFGVALYFTTIYLAGTNSDRDFLTNYSISILK